MRNLILLSTTLFITACAAQNPSSSVLPTDTSLQIGIIGGTLVTQAKSPITASTALIVFDNGHEEAVCSGALVSTDLLLTAAHCFLPHAQTPRLAGWRKFVIFGSRINLTTTDWHAQAQEISEMDYRVHPRYDDAHSLNDIAVIHLKKSVTAYAKPVPILQTPVLPGAVVSVSGFGRTTAAGTDNTTRDLYLLKSLTTKVSPQVTTKSSSTITIVSSASETPAEGDSGGPAYVVMSGRRYVWGIDSYADLRLPNVEFYTALAPQLAFINEVAKTLGAKPLTF